MGKATAGRKRKAGDRYPSGKLMPEYDRGCDGVQRRIALYAPANDKDKDRVRRSTETFDAIGRAMVNGLLDGRSLDPTVLCAAGRAYHQTYLYLYEGKGLQDSLGKLQPSEGGRPLSEETQESIKRKHDAQCDRLAKLKGNAGFWMMSILATREADSGPDWLDRLIFGKATLTDEARMSAALDGLEAIA